MSQPNSQNPIEDRGEESLPHLRERCEPVATNSSIPEWVFVVGALMAASAFIYLGDLLPSDEAGQFLAADSLIVKGPAGLGGEEIELTPLEELMKTGKANYQQVCQACHGTDGAGGSGIPPLVNSEWVSGPTQRFGLIILHGMKGPVTVNGQLYNDNMTPQASYFSDPEDLAAVMSYVRVTYGMDNIESDRLLVSPEVAANIQAIAYDGQTTEADLTANHDVFTEGALLDPTTGEAMP